MENSDRTEMIPIKRCDKRQRLNLIAVTYFYPFVLAAKFEWFSQVYINHIQKTRIDIGRDSMLNLLHPMQSAMLLTKVLEY